MVCNVVTTAMTYGTIAGGVALTNGVNLTLTNVVGQFSPQTKTVRIPIAGGYATVTYQYSITTGTTTVLYNISGGGGVATVAGQVVYDLGVWAGGTAGAIQHLDKPTVGMAIDQTITSTLGVTGLWISADAEEMWIAGGAAGVEARQTSDGAVCLPVLSFGVGCYTIIGSMDGYVYVTQYPTGKGTIFNWLSGTAMISPAYQAFPGKLLVSGRSGS
jgi:hypothetical protein